MIKFEAHLVFTKLFKLEDKIVKLDFVAQTDEKYASIL